MCRGAFHTCPERAEVDRHKAAHGCRHAAAELTATSSTSRKSRRTDPAALSFPCLRRSLGHGDRLHQRSHATDGDAAVELLRPIGVDLQEPLAVTLGGQVCRRDVVDVGQDVGDGLGAFVLKHEVRFVRADGQRRIRANTHGDGQTVKRSPHARWQLPCAGRRWCRSRLQAIPGPQGPSASSIPARRPPCWAAHGRCPCDSRYRSPCPAGDTSSGCRRPVASAW